MKKSLTVCLGALLILVVTSSSVTGQTAGELLAKMIEAQGGAIILENIKDTTLSGSMELVQMGLTGSLSIYQKEPNKMRIDIEIMGMLISQAFDGEKAYMTNPQTGSVEEMPEKATASFKRQALGNDSFLHPEKFGITYTFIGSEKVGDKDCFVLEQTYSDGHKVTIYADSTTYLPHKTKGLTLSQTGMEVMAETYFGDYKNINGTVVAHTITSYQEGQEYMRLTVSTITYNSGLEDSFFKLSP